MRRLLITLGIWIVLIAVLQQGAFAQQTTSSPQGGSQAETGGFFWRLWRAYIDEFNPPPSTNEPEPPRRAMPSPWDSPPFPGSEYQGYPLIGVLTAPRSGP